MASAAHRKKATSAPPAETGADAEARLDGFVEKFAPEHQRLIRDARRALRERFPTAFELVYDNYNFLAIGYSPTERTSDAVVSLAGAANGITLFFLQGARLADPDGVLRGSGKQVRSVRVDSAAVIERPEMRALLDAAAGARVPFPTDAPGRLVIKSVSAKQRPRRRPAS